MADPASFIASWLTPSSLFIFLNLVIGTIAITSRFGTAAAPDINQHHHHPQLLRSPSFLQRLSSFNLTRYYQPDCPDQPQLVPTSSLLHRLTSFNLSLHKHQPAHAETQHVEPQPQPEQVRTPSLLEPVTSFSLSLHKHAETQHVLPEPEKPELVRSPSLLQRIQSINFSRLYRSDSTHREDPGRSSGKAEEMRKSASERGGSMDSEWEEEEEVEKRRPQTARPVETTPSWREDEEVDAKADDFIYRFKKQLRLQRIDSLLRYRGGNS